MSDKEKKAAIPAEGTVDQAKPEVKEGFFEKIANKARAFAAKPAVKRTAKVVGKSLAAIGLIGVGWMLRDVTGGMETDDDDQVVLTEGELEESSEEETEANDE